MSEPMPLSYRPVVHLKLYDSTTELQSHIDAIKNTMLISRDFDAMWCKAFLATLSEAAKQWFSSLPPHLVGDFLELTEKFLYHFTASRAYQKIA